LQLLFYNAKNSDVVCILQDDNWIEELRKFGNESSEPDGVAEDIKSYSFSEIISEFILLEVSTPLVGWLSKKLQGRLKSGIENLNSNCIFQLRSKPEE